MNETIFEKINRFKEYYAELIDSALKKSNKSNSSIDILESKVLLCCLFDSLSSHIYPKDKNRIRFQNMVLNCTTWNAAEKISLLHLHRVFEIYDISIEFNDLKQYVRDEFVSKFSSIIKGGAQDKYGNTIDEIDTDRINIEEKWPKKPNGDLLELAQGITLDKFSHVHLLWLYRNSIIHEYRHPGGGINDVFRSKHNVPQYVGIREMKIGENDELYFEHSSIELEYPLEHFEKLCKESLDFIVEKYQREQTSPFKLYKEGGYWIPHFNSEEKANY